MHTLEDTDRSTAMELGISGNDQECSYEGEGCGDREFPIGSDLG